MIKNYDKYMGCAPITKFLVAPERDKHVKAAIKVLEKFKKQFDTIAFCGMSGALIAPQIAAHLKKELIMVRKKGDKRHSYHSVEGYADVKKYIIVDDFIDEGKTAKHIQRMIFDNVNQDAKCLGLLPVQELAGTGSGYQKTELETYIILEACKVKDKKKKG